MNYETAGADTPAAEGAQPEATVENSGATTGQQSEAETSEASASETTGDNPGDDAAAAPKRKHWAHERIDELTRQRREAERQAEYWRAMANQKANIDDLDYDDQIAARVTTRQREEMAQSAEYAVRSVSQQVFEAREAGIRERYADYDIVAKNPSLPVTSEMAEVILESEAGPELAYHLGKNPAEAARIARLNPRLQAAELGKLEARLTAPKPVAKQPPQPVQPVNGIAAGGARDPDKMSMSEYIAWRKGQN